ncbi:LOW QUALITY PROTEIN: hypothetical protein OSB04_027998 [Centaurea solstitialis]|uniref:Reverse transcriptase domain-containing protein n=1 Tax=Centaurea solstitialis TaxID=347529 RepID=A0AA38VX90_9ASTR|nr:LOW QUALITY PROTEIN: hypothetical protein OSB04_027998 [Centaurea solstitialis]
MEVLKQKISAIDMMAENSRIKEEVYGLFKVSSPKDFLSDRCLIRSGIFKNISARLEGPFELSEVKQAVWSYRNNKALGSEWALLRVHLEFLPSWEMTTLKLSNSSSSFSSILDGPMIVNEILYAARKNKLLIFKVDFEKEFDLLKWNYLDGQMESWVKRSISTTRVSMFVNGNPTKEFRTERGQGDPLELFLFFLAVEGLNVATIEAQSKGIFKGVYFDNLNEDVFILQYANDAIYFHGRLGVQER